MAKLAYKPFGILIGVLGGMLATAVFEKAWKLTPGDEDAPDATDRDHGWGEVLLAAALQGATFGLVKAAIDRGGATVFRRTTGTWPD